MFPKRSAFLGAVGLLGSVKVLGELVVAVGELALALVRAVTHLGVVLAHFGFIFADVGLEDPLGALFLAELVVGGLSFGVFSVIVSGGYLEGC